MSGLSADRKLFELDGRISPDKSACRKFPRLASYFPNKCRDVEIVTTYLEVR
jgi:hypothetical protein